MFAFVINFIYIFDQLIETTSYLKGLIYTVISMFRFGSYSDEYKAGC